MLGFHVDAGNDMLRGH